MLITVLVMALAISVEPFRIGMTVVMLNRPRPAWQLFAFLCGGFVMGLSVGLVVLFALGNVLPDSRHFTLPNVQLVIGCLMLVLAAIVAVSGRWGSQPEWLTHWFGRLLTGQSLVVAAIAGLGIALPSFDYLAALAMILAAGTSAATQVGVLVLFNIVAFAFVEIPLLAYLLAPGPTVRWVGALNTWIRSRRRAEVSAVLAVVGAVLLVAGITAR